MILNGTVVRHGKVIKDFKFHANCYWVEINSGEKIVFERRGDKGKWLDEKHRTITHALDALEKALLDVISKR